MADNTQLNLNTTSGDIYASDDIGGVKTQRVKIQLGADGVSDGDVASGNPIPVRGYFVTVSGLVTRPADTTAYTAGDAISDSTSSPTTGGFALSGAARVASGSGVITDAVITTSADAATLLQGEVWLFNQAVTNVNDNAAFAVSDAEIQTCVGKIPFLFEDAGNNGFFHAQNLQIGFTLLSGQAIRFLLKAKNNYTPVASEQFSVMLKIAQIG